MSETMSAHGPRVFPSPMRRGGRPGVVLSALVLSLGLGCRKEAEPTPAVSTGAPVVSTNADGAPDAEVPLLTEVAALKRLPNSTLFVAAIDGVMPMLDRLGRSALMAKHPERVKALAAASQTLIGHDLTQPAQWRALGVDLDAPFGCAVDAQDEAVVGIVFGGIADAEAAVTAIRAMAKRAGIELVETAVPDAKATLFGVGDDTDGVVVIAPDHWMVVVSNRGAPEHARRLLATQPAASLAGSARFRRATAATAYGRHLGAWLDIETLANRVARMWSSAKAAQFELQAKMVEQTVATAGDERADLEVELKRHRERWKAEHAAALEEQERTIQFLGTLLGKDASVALGANLTDAGLLVRAAWVLGAEAQLLGLFKEAPAPLPILRGLTKRPAYVAQANLDLEALTALVRSVSKTAGYTELIDDGAKMVLGLTGIDPLSLHETFTGAFGLAVTVDPALGDDEKPAKERLGGAAVIGLTDSANFSALLDRMVTSLGAEAERFITRTGDGAYTVRVPAWRTVDVRILGDHLVAATDPGFAARIANGAPLGGNTTGALGRVFTGGRSSTLGALDLGAFAELFTDGSFDFVEAERRIPETDPDPARAAKLEQLATMRAEAKALRTEEQKALKALRDGVLTRLGVVAARGWIADGVLHGFGGIFTGAPPREFVDWAIAQAVRFSDPEFAPNKRSQLRSAIWALEDELQL